MRPTKGGSDGCEDKTCEPLSKRHKGNTPSLHLNVGRTASNDDPTKDKLLDCITEHAAEYLCEDLGPLITDYARCCLEILTTKRLMRFDDISQSWTTTILFNTGRYYHAIAKLNGKFYVVGGYTAMGPLLSSLECYDDIRKQCTTVEATRPPLGMAANGAHQRLAASGGPQSVACEAAPLVAPLGAIFQMAATRPPLMNTKRWMHGVAVLNGKLYAVGGHDGSNVLSDVERYDDVSNQWTLVASLNTKRHCHGVGVLNGNLRGPTSFGKLYAVGGGDGDTGALSSVECYDDVKDQWATVASMNTPRCFFGVGVLNGKLYAVGGYDDITYETLSSVECYDDVSNKWTMVAPMNTTRRNHGVGILDHKLYVVGGQNKHGRVYTVERYNDISNTWSMVPSMALDTTLAETFC